MNNPRITGHLHNVAELGWQSCWSSKEMAVYLNFCYTWWWWWWTQPRQWRLLLLPLLLEQKFSAAGVSLCKRHCCCCCCRWWLLVKEKKVLCEIASISKINIWSAVRSKYTSSMTRQRRKRRRGTIVLLQKRKKNILPSRTMFLCQSSLNGKKRDDCETEFLFREEELQFSFMI